MSRIWVTSCIHVALINFIQIRTVGSAYPSETWPIYNSRGFKTYGRRKRALKFLNCLFRSRILISIFFKSFTVSKDKGFWPLEFNSTWPKLSIGSMNYTLLSEVTVHWNRIWDKHLNQMRNISVHVSVRHVRDIEMFAGIFSSIGTAFICIGAKIFNQAYNLSVPYAFVVWMYTILSRLQLYKLCLRILPRVNWHDF